MKELKLASIETHVADSRTCCLHPNSSTHRQMNEQELKALGVEPELIHTESHKSVNIQEEHLLSFYRTWCPKYRRKVLIGNVETRLKELLIETCASMKVDIIEMELMPDHVHILIEWA